MLTAAQVKVWTLSTLIGLGLPLLLVPGAAYSSLRDGTGVIQGLYRVHIGIIFGFFLTNHNPESPWVPELWVRVIVVVVFGKYMMIGYLDRQDFSFSARSPRSFKTSPPCHVQ